jgi:hypothetical protein
LFVDKYNLIATDFNNGYIYAVDPKGTLSWAISGEPFVQYLATDGANLYWTTNNGSTQVASVRVIPITASTPAQTLFSVNQNSAGGIAYDAGSKSVYVSFFGALESWNIATSAHTTLPISKDVGGGDLLLAGSTIYLGSYGSAQNGFANGGIYRAPLTLTSAAPVLTGGAYADPEHMITDGSFVYFFAQGGTTQPGGTTDLLRVSVNGGAVSTLATSVGSPGTTVPLAIDGNYVYFGHRGVARVAK